MGAKINDNESDDFWGDDRVLFIRERIRSCHSKLSDVGKFKNLFQTQENRNAIKSLFTNELVKCLFIPETLKLSTDPIGKFPKSKLLVFVKVLDNVTPKNCSSALISTELSGQSPFENLYQLSNTIFLPLVSNFSNQQKWGELTAQEVTDKFHSFLSSTTILCGQVKGETRLPMPPAENNGTPESYTANNNSVSILESAIITWTKQIKNVLKQDPEAPLKQGLNPLPNYEVEFWTTRSNNLNSIFDQLQSQRIRRILRALDQAKSTYCTAFARLCKDVYIARLEATDNIMYMQKMERWFDKLSSSDDFQSLNKLYKPLLYTLLMIWKQSNYYNTPTRLVIVIREICNALIDQSCRYISGEQIFSLIENEEALKAIEHLRKAVFICEAFKIGYFDMKAKAAIECPKHPWKIQSNAIFSRLDLFLDRCHDALEITQTIVHFTKLAKVEIGGTKGSTLTKSVEQIYKDFLVAVDVIKSLRYDIMDVEAKQFDNDFRRFRSQVREFERRLGSVISLAVEHCTTIHGSLQLVNLFESGLLERPIIQEEVESKYVALVQAFGADLKQVQELFLNHRDNPPIDHSKNFPPISGALMWCRGLITRVSLPLSKLQQLGRGIIDREEAKEVLKMQKTISASLQEFESQKVDLWGRNVKAISESKLMLPLLRRLPLTCELVTNFDPSLTKLLREVKYFLNLGIPVPDSALSIYQSAEVFRAWIGNIDLIVGMNNAVLKQMLPVERPLLAPYLAKFDLVVEKGLTELSWRSDGIDEFISEAMQQVKIVHGILKTMKDNFSVIDEIVSKWNSPIFYRKSKPIDCDELKHIIKISRTHRYDEIKESGKRMHNLLKDTNKVLRVSNASMEWRAYVDFVNSFVIEGLSTSVVTSLKVLLEQIDSDSIKREGKLPLLDIKLTLDATNGIMYNPSLGYSEKDDGIKNLIDDVIGSFLRISTMFKRLDTEGTYLREIHCNIDVNKYIAMTLEAVTDNELKCGKLKDQFEVYSHLWETDIESHFEIFCKEASYTTENGTRLLDLKKFDDAIDNFTEIKESVSKFLSPSDVGWLRIDTSPIKLQVSNHAMRWINRYTSYLLENVIHMMSELYYFMQAVTKGLDRGVGEGPQHNDVLMAVMSDIRDVRKKIEFVKEVIGPQRECVIILKKHGVDILSSYVAEKNIQDFIEEVPLAWEAVVKKSFQKKEEILPLQIASVEALKSNLDEFFLSIRVFRNEFRSNAPFKTLAESSKAFSSLDSYLNKLDDLDAKINEFHELEELFELQHNNYPEIGETRIEIKFLRQLWDFKCMLDFKINDWKNILWKDVNTDDLEDKVKTLRKELKEQGNTFQSMKGWQVFKDIEEQLVIMSTVLPLIADLHSDAMRPRHWASLARVCNVKAVEPTSKMFALSDIISLQLHKHKAEIEEIIEMAMKELKIEKKLREIEDVWDKIMLEYVAHKDTEMFVPRPSEELIEGMEGHQMELQGIYGMGKSMEYFKERVIGWQIKLRTVDDTLRMWISVARSWASLESIFLASADIRAQLPDDTKRFEGIDSDFKEVMKESVLETHCLTVCSKEGLYEVLKGMLQRLEICQKSLNEYLDIKKKIFPRFYFVSAVALLDMLANGTNPPKIMPYLGDCYDALADLNFVPIDTGKTSDRTVDKMIAKDGEIASLSENFTMEGEVENYLNQLTDTMRKSLKTILSDAMEKAAHWEIDNPRHEWIFNYPAQLCITGTQIYWTDEVQLALEEYESGQEDAVKRYLETCNDRLSCLIQLVLGELTTADRTKIISLITMDVHSRDVVDRLVAQKTEGPNAFAWQQQLRFEWEQPSQDVNVKICDFSCKYFYEWVGNTGRLVITPLTDRCYITLTMGLKLFLGGAPAGPAGTGKTETTKDLARALAIPCYVFNCSDQMNFQSIGDIFRGLAQTGAWGCFDEFNRIPIEVLSVVATQVKTIQDSIVKFSVPKNREKAFQGHPSGTPPCMVGSFDFMGDVISLIPTCGFFITMNPGYAGRTELPENLKALFRSCAMIRPDMMLIQENMLMAEGFQTARTLSVKFNKLYELSSALLSKQPHYDWGLRAVKSVLRVAGGMKRANPDLDESQILMRALRDFNTPKIPSHDIPIFLRVINDLFMGLKVTSKVDEDLKGKIVRVAKESGLQYDDTFVNKTCNLQELLDVRHSVMLLGPAGCAKTTIWKTLQAAHNLDNTKKVCISETVNPKAVTGDELYGYMTLAKEWKDGVLSIIMRGMSKNFGDLGYHDYQTSKWVVLDGDIDAVWIESMNTVMDDNKVLTLVSNERVPLSPAMRMVFEINSLKNATPATVSRAGILYINETDIGWRPFMETWVQSRSSKVEKNYLPSLFDRYIEPLVEMTRRGYKEVTSIRLINKVSTIIYLLEGLLPRIPESQLTSETIEMIFSFAAMWSFGGPMIVDKTGDYRKKFSEEFVAIFGSKLPKEGDCFDYFYNVEAEGWTHWSTQVTKYTPVKIGSNPGENSFTSLFVKTVETTRMTFLLDVLARNGRYAMFVGNAGTGKTGIIKSYLSNLDKDVDGIISNNIVMSYYTSSFTLQEELEGYIDKRSGSIFGPPMGKKMIFFIDDMNLPYIETYGTQNSISLLTQHMQHSSIFDRTDLGLRKQLKDIQYIAAMNPTAGSFEVCERCQRHFATFAVTMPSKSDLMTIFCSLFGGHMSSFQTGMQDLTGKIVDSAIQLHEAVSSHFLPSAVKFMYNWNMRELTNIFQGCCLAKGDYYIKPLMMVRLFIHEAQRVYADRLVTDTEVSEFNNIFQDVMKKTLVHIPIDEQFSEPLVYTNFVTTTDGAYLPIPSIEKLKFILDSKLAEYNETYAMMDLVLFKQAMLHITRISRIIQNPGGHAMLVGVGGSGKQSLCRLAAFICDYEVKQLAVTSNFNVDDLKEELRAMYMGAGVKGNQIVFLMTDTQIVNEKFLVYINSVLTNGWISDLFQKEDIDNILSSLSSAAKAEGIPDTREARIEYFISRIRMNLHLALAFSPVGDTFRIRARRFPGLVNCTGIDRFHPWPREALISVAERFIEDIDISGAEDFRSSLAVHMASEHLSVAKMSLHYYETQRRYNYVTPKSYLELISFYKYLLNSKRTELHRFIDRLDVGLSTLRKTAEDVAELQKDLKITMTKVDEKKSATDTLIEEMKEQQADAKIQQDAAQIEAEKANEESEKAQVIEAEAEQELSLAKPAMEAAAAAVDCLSKPMLTELKALAKPPSGVDKVTNACLILIEKEYKVKKQSWDRAKKMMQNVDAFKKKLAEFKGESITEEEIGFLQPYIDDENFTPEKMASKSAAASNLCNWVTNIISYNRIYVKVKPLMDSLDGARASKAAALASLEIAQKQVAEVQEKLSLLEEKYNFAVKEKEEVENQANALSTRADLAQRLVGGLASENVRWGDEIQRLRLSSLTLAGDCMIAAGFVSYLGAFNQEIREELWKDQWVTDLKERKIPMTEGTDPLAMLTNEGISAKMIAEGLPSDRTSVENGAIVSNSKRWPLLIDPQVQAIKWLKKREEGNLDIIQLTQKNWLKVLQNAITNGKCVIIENIGSEIDATLDPVLSRAIYKKGRSLYLKLGDDEVEYDIAFQLYLQTKLSNPHYRPEIAAQCTLINFIATEKGLEQQLLARVVELERKDLEEKARELTEAAVNYKIQLVELEDELLERLANAPDDILSDVPLIEGLEATKKTAKEINEAVEIGKETQKQVEKAREAYRPQAAEGAMLYFLLTKLCCIDHMYQYSLDSFLTFFEKSVYRAEQQNELLERVQSLRESLRSTIFTWVSRGLFERHKLIVLAQLTFNLIKRGVIGDVEWNEPHFQYLLRGPSKPGEQNPLGWLPDNAWDACQALSEIEEFGKFTTDLVEAAPRFREWFNSITPENEKLPLDWAGLDRTPFLKMLVVRALRPDRMSSALNNFIRRTLPNGSAYCDCDSTLNSIEILDQCLTDSTPKTPIYFILSPGANVVADLDTMATKYGFQKGISYHNVSMGQGQDLVAMSCLEAAHRNGHWVILNNVHLMPKWLIELEKKLDHYAAEGSHEKFRVFLTSDPSNVIPIGVLNRCIKLTNEPPTGLKANLKRAWCFFPKEHIEETDSKTKSILFGLCHFHSIMMERKLFGPMGFNMKYPFSIGDLRDSATCLQNYMENSGGGNIPWQDLKYIFGEIMYGGHIVNDFDRLLANEYLNFYMKDELLDETEMYPFAQEGVSFMSPAPTSFEKYIEHIDKGITSDTPVAFGLHPNAEIDFRTQQSNAMFSTLSELQPREVTNGDGTATPQLIAETMATDILEKFGEKLFDIEDLIRNLDEQGPYQNVFLQEMDVLNVLLEEMKRSIKELQLGFAGELTMSDSMENLMSSFYLDKIPASWAKLSWPSIRSLGSWLNNLADRIAQLDEWVANPSEIPKVTWISGLVNPTSFLTAICQVTAQKNQWELDKLVTFTDISKKISIDDVDSKSRDGAYIIGLSMQGARWEMNGNHIDSSKPKEMFCRMPIMTVKAVTKEKANVGGIYHCPVYMTEQRGPTWFFNAQLKTKSPPARWVLAGVALIADIS